MQNAKAKAKWIFFLDGWGAVLSAFVHGVVLVLLEKQIGMPTYVLFVLAAVACAFAVYSLTCSFRVGDNWRPFLKVIAIANLLFCAASIGLLFYFFEQLTGLGVFYFVAEIVVVVGLSVFELKASGGEGQTIQ